MIIDVEIMNQPFVGEYEEQPQYQSLIVTPSGDFIAADYYDIKLIKTTIRGMKLLNSTIKMDMIKLCKWDNNKLLI